MRVYPFALGLTAAAALFIGCGDDRNPPIQPPPAGGGGTGGTGTGTAGTGGAVGGGSGDCGNGVRDGVDEDCDGDDYGGDTCETFGFVGGTLACTSGCLLDQSNCEGAEDCFDGADNDGDLLRDCQDDDCATICADPCGYPQVLADPASAVGDTTAHANTLDVACADPAGSGPEVVYEVTAQATGVLDVELFSILNLALSVRTQCDVPGSALGCANRVIDGSGGEFLSVPVQQNDTVFIIVDGGDDGEYGAYSLNVGSRVPDCGDGTIDRPGEWCDDGENNDGDGCSATCQVESTESEPNDTFGQADPNPDPSFTHATIDPAGDVDYVTVEVTTGGAAILARIHDFGDGGCGANLIDTVIDLLDTDGTTVLASNNDSTSSCSSLIHSGLAVGTYFVRVTGDAGASPATFAYALEAHQQ